MLSSDISLLLEGYCQLDVELDDPNVLVWHKH